MVSDGRQVCWALIHDTPELFCAHGSAGRQHYYNRSDQGGPAFVPFLQVLKTVSLLMIIHSVGCGLIDTPRHENFRSVRY